MTPDRRLRFTREARKDVEDIRRHTIEGWGRDRWLAYVRGLEAVFERIRTAPETGRRRDVFAKGVRSMLYEAHVVFYYETSRGEVAVLCVLHQRRNAAALDWTGLAKR